MPVQAVQTAAKTPPRAQLQRRVSHLPVSSASSPPAASRRASKAGSTHVQLPAASKGFKPGAMARAQRSNRCSQSSRAVCCERKSRTCPGRQSVPQTGKGKSCPA